MADAKLSILVDIKEGIKATNDFVRKVNDGIEDVVKSYAAVSAAAVAVGYAIKKAFDAAEEIANIADETNKVNKQFDFLADAAGGSSTALRKAFDEVNAGILDTEDVLKSASVALINLSIPASDVAKNFEAARKISVGLGVDSIQAFEAINSAIASGNTKALKQVGIFLDAGDAVDKYANSLGVAAKFLTDAQRETALFNAIQEKVNKSFSNVDVNTKTTSESFKEFSTSAKDVGEAVAIALNKIFGPAVQSALGSYSDAFRRLGNEIMSRYGSEAEKAAASSDILTDKMKQLADVRALIAKQPEFAIVKQPEISALERSIKLLQEQKQIIADRAQIDEDAAIKFSTNSVKRVEQTQEEKKVTEELAKARQDFISKVLGLEAQLTQAAFARATDEQGIEEAKAARILQIEADTTLKIQESRRAAAEIGLAGTTQELIAEQAIRDQAMLQREQLEAESNQRILEAKTNAKIISGELDTSGGLKTLIFQKDLVDKQIANAEKGSEEEKKLKLKSLALERQISDAKIAVASSALGNLSTLMQTNSKELFAIGKAAAIADATIRGFQAFNLALATIPPPFGAIVGATSLAAAAVQISKIASTNLATGITEVPPGYPNDSFPANLQSGERVLSAPQNKDVTEFIKKNEGGSAGLEEVKEVLGGILAAVSSLQLNTVVNIGSKEIMREVRDGIRSGQQVLT